MSEIILAPSLLAADLGSLREEIGRVVEGGCDEIHIDIMDGHFVPNLSFGPDMVRAVRRMTDVPLDVHLMVDNPRDMIPPFADAGSDYLTVHVEAEDDILSLLDDIRARGVKPGLSFRPDTPVDAVTGLLVHVDIMLVMSVFPGFGGQSFIEDSYDRIRALARAASSLEKHPLISVDGGVGMDNVGRLVGAGANHIVAGTAIFGSNHPAENIRLMREKINRATGA